MRSSLRRGPGSIAWGLACVAIALRAFVWQRTEVVFNDGPAFLAIAEAFERGDVAAALSHPYHPLYSLLVAAVRRGLALSDPGASFRAAGVVAIASGGLAVAALHALLRRLFDARIALAGAALLAVHPLAVEFASDVQSDGPYLALFVAAAAALARALASAAPAAALGCGVLAGLAYLARPEGAGVALIGVALGVALVACPRPIEKRAPGLVRCATRGRWLAWTVALALGAALPIAPYAGWLSWHSGELRWTGKKSVGLLAGMSTAGDSSLRTPDLPPAPPPALHPRTQALLASEAAASNALAGEAVREDRALAERMSEGVSARAAVAREPVSARSPDRPRRTSLVALVDLLRTVLGAARPEIVALIALGLFASRGRAEGRALFVLAFVGLYGAVLLGLALHAGYVSKRHALPPLVLAFGWAGIGARVLGTGLLSGVARWRGGAPPRPHETRALALGSALALAVGVGHALRPQREAGLAERLAAEWLHVAGPPGGGLAVEKSRAAWYAAHAFVPLRDAPDETAAAWLGARAARFVIVDDAVLARRPGLAASLARDARELHRVEAHGVAARVLALRDGSGAAAGAASEQAE